MIASRSFVRTADKALKAMGGSIPATLEQEMNEKFPGHKEMRDILEHFEDYSLGDGKLQKKQLVTSSFLKHALTVERPDLKKSVPSEDVYIHVHVSNFTPIPLSELGWWIDKLNLHVEARFQEKINPGLDYQGFWPDNNYQAPPDWETRMS